MRGLLLSLLFCGMLAAPAAAFAQGGAPAVADPFEAQRAELRREVETAEARLAELRAERARLQARVDNAVALAMQERARQLMMSSEQGALQQLDALLATAQSDMLAQRERMLALGDAVRRRSGAMLVLMMSVDSTESAALTLAEVRVNGVMVADRTYGDLSVQAFRDGAVDQLYRADVLPTVQRLHVRVTIDGRVVEHQRDVLTAGDALTYVRFVVRGGMLASETWSTVTGDPR
jgi:TolA-binding protein